MWPKYPLSKVLTESKIESLSSDASKRIRVKLNVLGVEKRPESSEVEGATKYYLRKSGQFIYGKQNLHKGAFGIIPDDLDGFESSSDLPAFDVNEICYPEWIFYFFKQGDFYLKLDAIAKGIGSKRIQPKDLLKILIPIPDKEVQRNILEEIRSFEKSITDLLVEFESQNILIQKAIETSILEGICGKLTAKGSFSNQKSETGGELLQNIRNAKKIYARDNNLKIGASRIIDKSKIPFTIPKSWAWSHLDELVEFGTTISYGVLMPDNHTPTGVPLVRVGDLENAIAGILPAKFIKQEISERYKRTILRGGEILIAVVGSTIGKVAIAPPNWAGANIARAVCRCVIAQQIDAKYIEYVLKSKYIHEYFVQSSRSIGQPTLNINVVNEALIPLPSAKEQREIVLRLQEIESMYAELNKEIVLKRDNVVALQRNQLSKLFGNPSFQIPSNVTVDTTKEKTAVFDFNFVNNNLSLQTMNDLTEIVKENGKLSAINLWKLSSFAEDIDAFYEELKRKVEVEKTIVESSEKGYLELNK